MWRYLIVELPRADEARRDEVFWEQGRSGWELIQVLPGTWADVARADHVTLVFKRPAAEDIGV